MRVCFVCKNLESHKLCTMIVIMTTAHLPYNFSTKHPLYLFIQYVPVLNVFILRRKVSITTKDIHVSWCYREMCVCLQIRSYMRNALQRLPGTLFSHHKLAGIIMTNDCFFLLVMNTLLLMMGPVEAMVFLLSLCIRHYCCCCYMIRAINMEVNVW